MFGFNSISIWFPCYLLSEFLLPKALYRHFHSQLFHNCFVPSETSAQFQQCLVFSVSFFLCLWLWCYIPRDKVIPMYGRCYIPRETRLSQCMAGAWFSPSQAWGRIVVYWPECWYLPYSIHFSEFIPISFTRKRTIQENTPKSTIFVTVWYENGRQGYFDVQSVITVRDLLQQTLVQTKTSCQVLHIAIPITDGP